MGDSAGGSEVPHGERSLPLGGLLLPHGSVVSCPRPPRAVSQRTQDTRQPHGPQVSS